MIIKSMSRKTPSFHQLIRYIDHVQDAGAPIHHNLVEKSPTAIQTEFQTNARLLPPRKNGNILYHEVLSFGEKDSAHLSPAILEDLTRTYLEKRAPHALAYARAHFDTDSPHVHLMLSANNLESTKRLRLSKKQFRKVQKEVEEYQKQQYPFLEHSLAQGKRKTAAPRISREERERARRGEQKPTRKEEVRQLVSTVLEKAPSGTACYQHLLSLGLKLYKRGNLVGIEEKKNGRKYRLKTLGLAETFDRAFETWRRLPERQCQLDQLTSKKRRDRGRER